MDPIHKMKREKSVAKPPTAKPMNQFGQMRTRYQSVIQVNVNGATVAVFKFQSAAQEISNKPQNFRSRKLAIFGAFSDNIPGYRLTFENRCGGAISFNLSSRRTFHKAKWIN